MLKIFSLLLISLFNSTNISCTFTLERSIRTSFRMYLKLFCRFSTLKNWYIYELYQTCMDPFPPLLNTLYFFIENVVKQL